MPGMNIVDEPLAVFNKRPATIETTAMVGDSESDIQAAIDAGVKSVAVTFGYAHVPAEDLGANVLIDHFDELPRALQEIAGD